MLYAWCLLPWRGWAQRSWLRAKGVGQRAQTHDLRSTSIHVVGSNVLALGHHSARSNSMEPAPWTDIIIVFHAIVLQHLRASPILMQSRACSSKAWRSSKNLFFVMGVSAYTGLNHPCGQLSINIFSWINLKFSSLECSVIKYRSTNYHIVRETWRPLKPRPISSTRKTHLLWVAHQQ